MKNIVLFCTLFLLNNTFAQNIVGKWKCIATYSSFDNKKTNMQAALTKSRCVACCAIEGLSDMEGS